MQNPLLIWQNPVFIRFVRSELRLKKSLFWYLLTVVLASFTVAITIVPQLGQGVALADAAPRALLPLLIIQGILLLFMATGRVAGGITREKVEDVLNYQRMTPLPLTAKILGYLFGLPVREYVLFAITLPFLLFVVIAGKLPPLPIAIYYFVFFLSTLLYHLTGMVAGMVARKWRFAARFSEIMVIVLYFILPQLTHLGLVFLEFLTVRPTFREYILPLISKSGDTDFEMSQLDLLLSRSVPFFHLQISATVFALLIQSLLAICFFRIIQRKWQGEDVPSISKPMALTITGAFAFMSLANLWPTLTRSEAALPILQSDAVEVAASAVLAIPAVLVLSSCVLMVILLFSALPDPLAYRRGILRAYRQDKEALDWHEDAASGLPLLGGLLVLLGLLLGTAVVTMVRAGYHDGLTTSPWLILFLFAASGLFLLYFQSLKEYFGRARVVIIILLHWVVPILVATLVISPNPVANWPIAVTISALSPLAMLLLAAVPVWSDENLTEQAAVIYRALGLSFLLMVIIIAYLQWQLARRRAALLKSLRQSWQKPAGDH